MINKPVVLQLYSWLQKDQTRMILSIYAFCSKRVLFSEHFPLCFRWDAVSVWQACTHTEEALKHKAQAGFACKAGHVTAVEFNLCSNPVSTFISWVKRKEIGDFCSLNLCDVTEGFLSLLPSLPQARPYPVCFLPLSELYQHSLCFYRLSLLC